MSARGMSRGINYTQCLRAFCEHFFPLLLHSITTTASTSLRCGKKKIPQDPVQHPHKNLPALKIPTSCKTAEWDPPKQSRQANNSS
jgi:hypothetical protein